MGTQFKSIFTGYIYTNRTCGRLEGEPASSDFLLLLEQGELLLPSTGAPAPSTKSLVLSHPSEALSPPFPNRSCAPSTTLKNLLFLLPSPLHSYPGSLPRDLTDAVKGVPVMNWSWKVQKGDFPYLYYVRHILRISSWNSEHLSHGNSAIKGRF